MLIHNLNFEHHEITNTRLLTLSGKLGHDVPILIHRVA